MYSQRIGHWRIYWYTQKIGTQRYKLKPGQLVHESNVQTLRSLYQSHSSTTRQWQIVAMTSYLREEATPIVASWYRNLKANVKSPHFVLFRRQRHSLPQLCTCGDPRQHKMTVNMLSLAEYLPEFWCDKDIFPPHISFFEDLCEDFTNFIFIFIIMRTVNVSVPILQSDPDGFTDLPLHGFPSPLIKVLGQVKSGTIISQLPCNM